MSAVTLPFVRREPRTSDAAAAVMQALTRGAPDTAFTVLVPATGGAPRDRKKAYLSARVTQDNLRHSLIPGPLLTRLEEDRLIPWRAFLATQKRASSAELLTLSVLAASVVVPHILPRRMAGKVEVTGAYTADTAGLDAAEARAARVLPPSIVLRSRERLTALWGLAAPLDVSKTAGEVRALRLLQMIAAAVGGEAAPEALAQATIPLPGFVARNLIDFWQDPVVCTAITPAAVYSLDDVVAAFSGLENA